MSIRHLNQIISIAPDFQSIEWRLGGPASDFIFPDPGDRFYQQHSAKELANGDILLFDNGNFRPAQEGGEYSRALQLRLDFDNMTASKVWEYRRQPDHFAGCCSNVTRLSNGNTVMIFGSDFNTACCWVHELVEADPLGSEVWLVHITSPGLVTQYRVTPILSINGETALCDLGTGCAGVVPLPALSDWGILIMAGLLLAAFLWAPWWRRRQPSGLRIQSDAAPVIYSAGQIQKAGLAGV